MLFSRDVQVYKVRRESKRGHNLDRYFYELEVEECRKKEKDKLQGEVTERRNINSKISQLIIQGWPTEEIQTAVEREFPNESSTRINNLIEHWSNQYKNSKIYVDRIIQKLNNGEILKKVADNNIKMICGRYSLLKNAIESYYNSKIAEMEEEK